VFLRERTVVRGPWRDGVMPRFNLLMPFDSDHAEFTRGFEAGRVYDLVGNLLATDANPDEWADFMPLTVHASNAEMMLRIAESHECHVYSEDVEDDSNWLHVTFSSEVANSQPGPQ
jgi:hypothetical protein